MKQEGKRCSDGNDQHQHVVNDGENQEKEVVVDAKSRVLCKSADHKKVGDEPAQAIEGFDEEDDVIELWNISEIGES